MLERLTRSSLEALSRVAPEAPCLSLYLETNRKVVTPAREADRLLRLLPRAASTLMEHGLSEEQADTVLRPLRDLGRDLESWQHPQEGLALFACSGRAQGFYLPQAVPETLGVAEEFDLAPLVGVLPSAERYLVLALSLQETRVISVDTTGPTRLEPAGMPASYAAAVPDDEPHPGIWQQSSGHSGAGRRTVMVHGPSDAGAEHKLRAYFRQVAKALHSAGAPDVPLVLASDEPHFPHFRAVSDETRLLEEGLAGNPDALSDAELAERAGEVVEKAARRRFEQARRRYEEMPDRRRATNLISDVVAAAAEGRVETLFVDLSAQLWGLFDPRLQHTEIHSEPEPGDIDLMNLAVCRTMAKGGEVVTDALPGGTAGSPLSAILRY